MIKSIRKRDGKIVQFDSEKIAAAIAKAFRAVGDDPGTTPAKLSCKVVDAAEQQFQKSVPGVEDIQDIVERTLIEEGYAEAAKAYILYRQRRADVGKRSAIWAWLTTSS